MLFIIQANDNSLRFFFRARIGDFITLEWETNKSKTHGTTDSQKEYYKKTDRSHNQHKLRIWLSFANIFVPMTRFSNVINQSIHGICFHEINMANVNTSDLGIHWHWFVWYLKWWKAETSSCWRTKKYLGQREKSICPSLSLSFIILFLLCFIFIEENTFYFHCISHIIKRKLHLLAFFPNHSCRLKTIQINRNIFSDYCLYLFSLQCRKFTPNQVCSVHIVWNLPSLNAEMEKCL